MKRWLIEILGGYYSKSETLTAVVADLFNTVGPEDILREENGKLLFEGRVLTDGEANLLKAEAAALMKSRLWKVLEREMQYQANKRMYVDSKSELDLIAGKLMVYHLDIMRTRMKKLIGSS